MKAIINILVTAAIFFSVSLIINWALGDPNNSKELLRLTASSLVFGIVMYPTSKFIDRTFSEKNKTS